VNQGQIDFVLAEEQPEPPKRAQHRDRERDHVAASSEKSSKRRASKDDSRSVRKSRVSRPRRPR
jgi:hypothetical protein